MSYVIGTNRLGAGCHRQDREIRKYKETNSTLCRLFMEYPGNKIKKSHHSYPLSLLSLFSTNKQQQNQNCLLINLQFL